MFLSMINSTKFDSQSHPDTDKANVLAYQVEQLYASALPALVATIINAFILSVVLWLVIDQSIIIGWLITVIFVSLLRSAIVFRYKKSQPKENVTYWYRLFFIGTFFSSLLWGLSPLFLFPESDIARQVFLAFVIGGMVAGSLTTLSHIKILIYTYLSVTLIPVLLRFYISDSELGLSMGVMLTLYFIMMLIAARRTHNNILQNIYLHLENIERERSLQQSEHKYQTILDTATDAFFLHDLNGKFIDVNQEACTSLGYTRNELLSMSVSDVVKQSEKISYNNVLQKLIQGDAVREEGIHQCKDGSTFPVEVSIGLIKMNNEELFSVLARDITERQRIDNMKNEFISTVSHELRTPLTSIRGSLGLISGGAVGELPEQAKEMLQVAGNNTERLLLLINDILDIQKIKSGQMTFNFDCVDVMLCIEKALTDNAAFAEQYNVKFVITDKVDDAYVYADKARLSQVMANLMSNAAKFSNQGDSVEIGLTKNNDHYIISVTDHGSGIPEEFFDKLFDKFTQSDSSDTREKGGTGLGLNITKLIVEMHKGKIYFDSKVGSGTRFYIELPVYSLN